MCSCQAGKVKGVETEEWGPHYWKLLHKLSLKAGTLTDSNFQAEEMRLWVRIFRETGKAIPCEDCRNHYKDWLLAHPIKPFQDLPYLEKGDWIRNWWWALHSDVNRRTQKSNIDFSELAETYASVFTRFEIATIEKYNGKACLASQVKLFDFKEWKKSIIILNSFYY
jgi:hypothetical protein